MTAPSPAGLSPLLDQLDEARALVESVADDVHAAWIQTKLAQGISSRPSSDGIEQMVPYADLPEHLKELDRATVRAVFASPTLQNRLRPARDGELKAALIEWAAPDEELGWSGCPAVAEHAQEIADFLWERGLTR